MPCPIPVLLRPAVPVSLDVYVLILSLNHLVTMAWIANSDYVTNVLKAPSGNGFNRTCVNLYEGMTRISDNHSSHVWQPPVTAFMEPGAFRYQKPPMCAFLDGCDDVVEDVSGADHEAGVGQGPKKRKLTVDQAKALETSFDMDNKLEAERKQKLADELGLHPRRVAVWFQNRRARWKTRRVQQDYDGLKSDYDAVVAENEKLKAEVERLNGELQRGRSAMGNQSSAEHAENIKVEGVAMDDGMEEKKKELQCRVMMKMKAMKRESSKESMISTTNSEEGSDVMQPEPYLGYMFPSSDHEERSLQELWALQPQVDFLPH